MNELSFLERLNLAIEFAPAMIAIIFTLLITIMSKIASTKGNAFSIMSSVVVVGILGYALYLQIKASTNRFMDDFKLKTKISCLEKKIDLLGQSQDIRGLRIESCETFKRLVELDKN